MAVRALEIAIRNNSAYFWKFFRAGHWNSSQLGLDSSRVEWPLSLSSWKYFFLFFCATSVRIIRIDSSCRSNFFESIWIFYFFLSRLEWYSSRLKLKLWHVKIFFSSILQLEPTRLKFESTRMTANWKMLNIFLYEWLFNFNFWGPLSL